MKKELSKEYVAFAIISWILFIGVLGLILYLSLQNGEAAKATGKDYIHRLAQFYYGVDDIPESVMLGFVFVAVVYFVYIHIIWFIKRRRCD